MHCAGRLPTLAFALFAGLPPLAPGAIADEATDQLARTLIARFYDDLAPNSAALGAYMGTGFQIIGSDGLRFDRDTYPGFAKEVSSYDISDLVARRDADLITATFEVTYIGSFQGVARDVPKLARLAVFAETGGEWKIEALAALGTGENDMGDTAPGILARWLAAAASGDAGRIRRLTAPDFQLQQADGKGVGREDYLPGTPGGEASARVEGLTATSFSNTMVMRYSLNDGGRLLPRLTVFQRIDGEWLVSAEALFPAAGG